MLELFIHFVSGPHPKHVGFIQKEKKKEKKTETEAFKVIFKAQSITHSYLERTAVSEKVIWWIFIGQLHVSGDERARARDVLLSLLDHAVQ